MAITKINSNAILDGTIATTDIADGAVTSVKTTGVGGANTPAFLAYKTGGNQTIANSTESRITLATELYDIGGCFNNTGSSTTLNGLTAPEYSFTPNVAGKYLIGVKVHMETATGSNYYNILYAKKNTSYIIEMQSYKENGSARGVAASTIVDLNGTGDYVNMAVWQNTGSNKICYQNQNSTYFFACKIIT